MKVSQDLKNKMQFLFYEKAAIENKKKQYYTELGEVWEQFLKENGLDETVKYIGKLDWKIRTARLFWCEDGCVVFGNEGNYVTAAASCIDESLEIQMQYILDNYVPVKD